MKRKSKSRLRAAAILALGALRRPRREEPEPILEEHGGGDPRAELVVALLLFAAAACAAMFVVVYVVEFANRTQWLGLCLGASLLLIAAALIYAGETFVPTEELEEEYPPIEHPEEQDELNRLGRESVAGFTRKRLLAGAAGAAGAALGAALIAPAASFGPFLDTKSFYYSPWRRDRRLVDEDGKPFKAAEIEFETFYTAYPQDAYRDELAAPLVVVRIDPSELELPPERADWAPEGVLAYSKICTHAGCAIGLYRYPRFPQAEPAPALVCPCHYSTFNPADGGKVTFGPAGRDLPQLPLKVDSEGVLRAAGNFSAPVGPSFWGVRTRRPSA